MEDILIAAVTCAHFPGLSAELFENDDGDQLIAAVFATAELLEHMASEVLHTQRDKDSRKAPQCCSL